jgi:hypothetical protein
LIVVSSDLKKEKSIVVDIFDQVDIEEGVESEQNNNDKVQKVMM